MNGKQRISLSKYFLNLLLGNFIKNTVFKHRKNPNIKINFSLYSLMNTFSFTCILLS